jgi:CubicO group peptidase (beta-lactamase class C family)
MQLPRCSLLVISTFLAIQSAYFDVEPRCIHGFEWQEVRPEEVGLSSAKLQALQEELARRNTKAFLVVRNDKIAFEWYAGDHGPDRRHYTASLAKAVVAGLAVAIALEDGWVRLDDPVCRYIREWQADPQKQKITLRHLGSHTSGLDDSRPNEEAPWKAAFWRREAPPNDPFTISRDQAPVLFPPGERFHYSNPGIAMLTYAVASAMRSAPENNVRALLRERIYRPIGIQDHEWSIGYDQTFTVDGLPLVAGWGGGSFTARALARIGRLVLRKGNWEGKQILRPETIEAITTSSGLPGHCGIGWWTNVDGRFPSLPADATWGAGAQEQLLLVIPSLRLIMVRNGGALSPKEESSIVWERYLFAPLMQTLLDRPETNWQGNVPVGGSTVISRPENSRPRPPYPPSPVVEWIEWDPPETIIRLARGSDNWPISWADDDRLYTAFGDGHGFEPKLPVKLSLGLAWVEGIPPAIRGFNLRSPTAEQLGDGPRGKKASGMLMVDGVLYMLVRNAGNSQLARSTDRGRTWEWAPWKFTVSFGCPTFVNFGRNYAGARDDYVYIFSPDSNDAYTPADQMVLARVPKTDLFRQEAYQYFAGFDERGNPLWTPDITKRQGVFRNPGRCGRSGITFNPGLKRYFWWQANPHSPHPQGNRFAGGFAIYDAPEPWGPWTTVYFTEMWDVGPGESGCFPTKWMSEDGTQMWLVFSGDDCFSVRRAKLVLQGRTGR